MQTGDPHFARLAAGEIKDDRTLADDGLQILGDLVARRQVGIEVILAVEDRHLVDLRLQAKPRAHSLLYADAVDHRQHAGHAGIDKAHLCVGFGAEFGRGAGKQLGA